MRARCLSVASLVLCLTMGSVFAGCGGNATTSPVAGGAPGIPALSSARAQTPNASQALRAHRDGAGFATLFGFDGTDGAGSIAPMIVVKGEMYGTTDVGGAYPSAPLIKSGHWLYGTTYRGGTSGLGSVFSMSTAGSESVLYSFAPGTDAANPQTPLLDVKGTLYGTSFNGGTNGTGAGFSVTTSGKETVLHSFGSGSDGKNPFGGLAYLSGTLYGTTGFGGTGACGSFACGTIFSITPAGTETVLYDFTGQSDGEFSEAGLTVLGNALYGTTSRGGSGSGGTAFELTPG